MPAPERPGPEPGPGAEKRPIPYHREARFRNEVASESAFFAAQRTLFDSPTTLSAYRFQLNQVFHVAVVGEPPPPEIDTKLQAILSAGEPVDLPEDILRVLHERGIAVRRFGPWWEGHYWSGSQR